MKLLLDTHALIWFSQADNNLSQTAKSAITNPENACFVSIVSFWEMAIKIKTGKLKLKFSLEDLKNLAMQNDIKILPITFAHILPITTMDLYHSDPFDRLLIAQAICENMAIISKDEKFSYYDVSVIW